MNSDKYLISVDIKIVSLLILLCFCYCTPKKTTEEIALSPDLTVQEIENDVFLVTHRFPWAANSLLVKVAPDECILVDTPWENEATKLLVEWMREKYGDIKLTVINTHFHRDNLGGNG